MSRASKSGHAGVSDKKREVGGNSENGLKSPYRRAGSTAAPSASNKSKLYNYVTASTSSGDVDELKFYGGSHSIMQL